jgi:hypothetical protein
MDSGPAPSGASRNDEDVHIPSSAGGSNQFISDSPPSITIAAPVT